VTEIVEKGKNVRENFMVRLAIVIFVFPILVLAFHALLIIPAFFVGPLLMHFGGHPKFWANTLSLVALLPACWGAIAICKRIWTGLK
jgi:uncharacterized RDD family membrane protein YckC